jgi:hypothetical protein
MVAFGPPIIPEGFLIIARRFIAGKITKIARVPKERLRFSVCVSAGLRDLKGAAYVSMP